MSQRPVVQTLPIPLEQGRAPATRQHDVRRPHAGGVAPPPTPLLPGEDPAYRAAISARHYEQLAPSGVVEEALVRDVIDAMCEIEVWARHRATLLVAHRHDGIMAVLAPFFDPTELDALIGKWRRGEPDALDVVARHLDELDPDGALVNMHTMRRHKDDFDRLNADLTKARNARIIAFQELERRRLLRAQVWRSLGMLEADAIALLTQKHREPIAVPDDDETDLGLPRRATAAPMPAGTPMPRKGPARQADGTGDADAASGTRPWSQDAAPSAARAKNGPVARDRPDAAPARGQPAGAATTGRDPARPSMGEPRTAPASNRPSTLECQPRPTPTGPDPAVRKRRGGGEMQ